MEWSVFLFQKPVKSAYLDVGSGEPRPTHPPPPPPKAAGCDKKLTKTQGTDPSSTSQIFVLNRTDVIYGLAC